MVKAELIAHLTEKKLAFTPEMTVPQLKEIALENEHLEEVQSALKAHGVEFTPENTIEELEVMLETALIVSTRKELTKRGIDFTEEDSLDELKELLEDAIEAEKEKEDEKQDSPDGFVKVRNESTRVINGMKPWQIRSIAPENVGLYLSYGCSLYNGEVSQETQEEKKDDAQGDLAPHLR